SRRTSDYRARSFYVIYMVGGIIDVVALTSIHFLVLLPSNGPFLDVFLASTAPGRVFLFFAWSTRTCQGFTNLFMALNRVTAVLAPFRHRKIWSLRYVRTMCFLVQFSAGFSVWVFAASRDVYWCKTAGGSWFIQFHETPSSHRFFRYVFAQSIVSMLTIACYALLLLNLKMHRNITTIRQTSSENPMVNRHAQALTHLAICVCAMELIYYAMYCYGFIMNANFEWDLGKCYVGYFVIADLYSGLPPFLLLYFSSPIRADVRRLLERIVNR
ncbi:hypothetical protein PMAYCL1PPCAC_14772, partial [Pristionchus mayeri]